MEYDGFDFKKPNYAAVFRQRLHVLAEIRKDPACLPELKAYYRENPADFISDWGVTFDPRNAERDLPTTIPFILFPKQREWVDWLIGHWRAGTPGLTEKSRDMGISWLSMGVSCTLCLFHDGVAVGCGSRKEDLVDKIGTMKPLLPKARMFMEHLPEEFRGGWVPWRDAPFMRINFPDTGSIIAGEAGDQIGRGDRTSYYLVDEAQPLDAKIVTPFGLSMMADMRIGSWVVGKDGRSRRVTHINECGVHDVFRVTFRDGTSTECSPNHLWTVQRVFGSNKKTMTLRTHDLIDKLSYESPGGQHQYRYRVPACEPVEFRPSRPAYVAELPLDPYVVGVLLGDGAVNSGTVRITSSDEEIIENVRHLLPEGVIIGAYDGRYSYNIVDVLGRRGRIAGGAYPMSRAKLAVIAAGIAGSVGPDKFIPERYKLAKVSERLSLLQGLMDTDGSACAGSAAFYTSSRRLADGVRFLVQSLGGIAHFNVKPDRRGHRDQYAIQLALPSGMAPFRLRRKLEKLRPRKHSLARTIVSIEHVGRKPVRCITVGAPDGLYLTDNFIVTHNSAHLERPDLVEMSLSQTTNCRIDMSSVNGMNNPFAKKRHEGKVDVFLFDWKSDPRKDQAWYEKQCAELDPVTVAQEIDRDYSASVEGIVIPGTWVRAAINAVEKLDIKPSGVRGLALDVADEGVDKNALCGNHGIEIDFLDEWSGKGGDLFVTTQRVFRTCDERGLDTFRYDADGLGAGIRGDARIINETRKAAGAHRIVVEGFRGSEGVFDPDGIVDGTVGFGGDKGRTNKDYFANRKAQSWWSLRGRFQKTYRWVVEGVPCSSDDIISISSKVPLYLKLVAELSQPTFNVNQVGKILIDKKPDGMKSPNLADSAMIKFASIEQAPMKITADMIAQVQRSGRGRRF